MALLLALIRKIPLSNKLVQSGRWEMPAVVPIRRIEGTVLGLVGFGHIPRLVAPKAQAFGIRVIACDPYAKPEAFKTAGVESVDFDTLLQSADYVSVHAPLLPATRGMMNAAAFAKMKKGAYIVNTARGPLIDEPALVAALDSGQIGGAGLDVVTSEPLAKDSPLLGRDNVIISPHTAFYSIEALNELQTKCATDVARVLSGEKAVYPISACLSEEVAEPDGAPIKVRLLGEDLVVFRDSKGRVGVLDEFCSHRRASLLFARNEECGLRCLYHGWKFDVDGNVVEMASEPANSLIPERVRHKAYPTREAGGFVWAYMRHHPYCLARPRVGPSSLCFPSKMRGWRARWRNHCF